MPAAGVGVAGSASEVGSGGEAGASPSPCSTASDCPPPPNACAVARCTAGLCGSENVRAGQVSFVDVLGDCRTTVACDGHGHAQTVVDTANVPTPPNPCLAGTCDFAGTPGTEPLPA